MFAAIGVAVLLLMVFGGFVLTGGSLGAIAHAVPNEMMIIGGAAAGATIAGNLSRFGYDAQEGMVVVRYDAAVTRAGGAAVTTRRFEAREPADGTAATVAPAINAAANRVAMEVAQWVAGQ